MFDGDDSVTDVSSTGFVGEVGNAIGGTIIGVLLFLGAFVLLWWNEGRENLALVAKRSVPLQASTPQPAAEGQFVAAQGTLDAPTPASDGEFGIGGSYVYLRRKAEMYAWYEDKDTETRKNIGGGSTKTTTYNYRLRWDESPDNSANFRHSAGHENPPMTVRSAAFPPAALSCGAYALNPQKLEFPPGQTLPLGGVRAPEAWSSEGNYFYRRVPERLRAGDNPGDLRVSYTAVSNHQPVVLLAKVQGNSLVPFPTKSAQLYRAFIGTREDAIATLQHEYSVLTWILRGVGFLMMWFGLMFCFSLLIQVLDFLPFVGNIAGCMVGFVTFGVALSLSIATIIVAYIAHNVIALIITLLLIGGTLLFLARRQQNRAAA